MLNITRRLAVLTAGVVMSLAAAAPPTAYGGYLVFSRGSDIWIARDDGTAPQLLVTAASLGEVRLQKPAAAPGGDAIAFESWNTDSTRVYAWEAGAVRKVGDGWATGNIWGGAAASSNDPDVTADRRVIFQSDAVAVTGGCDLYGCGSDGTSASGLVSTLLSGEDRRALPAQCDSARDPAANPAQFAYVGCWVDLDPTDPWNPIAYALRTTDGANDRMVSYDDKVQHDPGWSLDGSQLVTSEEGTEPGIWVYPADGSAARLAVVPQAGATPFASPRFMGADRIIFAKNGDVWSVPAGCDRCAFPAQATQITHLGAINEVAWTSAVSFRVPAPAPPKATPTPTPPQPAAVKLSSLTMKPSGFRALHRGSSIVTKGGATVTFTLSEKARVTFSIRKASGAALKGTFSLTAKRGANRLRFSGRLGGHALKAGRYRLLAQAKTADGRKSATVSVKFQIRH